MTESKELKPKSFRINDETADKFKEISGAIGGNQQETLAKLIEAYEFQSGKAILTDKKADIEQFEKYVTTLTRMYMGSLEDNQNITETVRTEYDAQLKSKDATIQDLQEKLTVAKELKEELTLRAKSHADENVRLNGVIESMIKEYEAKTDDLQSMLEDKDKLNRALTDSCNDLKHKVDDMEAEHEELQTLKHDYDVIVKERDTLAHDKDQLQKDFQTKVDELQNDLQSKTVTSEKELEGQKQHEEEVLERLKEQSKIAMDKAILELKRKHQEQVEKLKEQKQNEVDKYQQKYFDLLEKLQSEQKANKPTEKE